MTTKTKCPLTGLDAIADYDERNYGFFKIQLEGIKDCQYLFPGHPNAGLDENTIKVFEELTKEDLIKKGKLLHWLYLNNQMAKQKNTTFKIPRLCLEHLNTNLAKKEDCNPEIEFISEVIDVSKKEITPAQKLDGLLEYIYNDMEDLGQNKTIINCELFPIVATIKPTEVSSLMNELVEKKYIKPNYLNEKFPPLGQIKAEFKFSPKSEGFTAHNALKKRKSQKRSS